MSGRSRVYNHVRPWRVGPSREAKARRAAGEGEEGPARMVRGRPMRWFVLLRVKIEKATREPVQLHITSDIGMRSPVTDR